MTKRKVRSLKDNRRTNSLFPLRFTSRKSVCFAKKGILKEEN